MPVSSISQAVKVLKNDGVIVFPTDTVWGVGVLLTKPQAITKLYQIKNRPDNQPTGIFIDSITMAETYGYLNAQAYRLADQYWPGQVSLIVKASDKVPREILGLDQTVSLRIPDHPITSRLLRQLGHPLVQTSANFAGQSTPTSFGNIQAEFLARVDYVIEGESLNQQASTIVDTTGDQIRVLRPGPIHIK